MFVRIPHDHFENVIAPGGQQVFLTPQGIDVLVVSGLSFDSEKAVSVQTDPVSLFFRVDDSFAVHN
jgi:hypothetical protein